jgi:hypothetical protein
VPVVNVGDRQGGRFRFGAVADVPLSEAAISAALRQALAGGRREPAGARDHPAPPAAPRIVEALRHWSIPRPPRKRFHETI